MSGQFPILQEAALAVYPPIGRAARITGEVIVEVTVSSGKVTATEVKPVPDFWLVARSPLQTCRFASDVNGKFTVTYAYAMSAEETDSPTIGHLLAILVHEDTKTTHIYIQVAIRASQQKIHAVKHPAEARRVAKAECTAAEREGLLAALAAEEDDEEELSS